MAWYKGNFHCHSRKSDGRATVEQVAKFYRFSGFDFLGISDHNVLTAVEEYCHIVGILGIPCCEFTSQTTNCHVLGIDVTNSIVPELEGHRPAASMQGFSVDESRKIMTLQEGVDKINKNGGIAVLCHPFWKWAYNWRIASAVRDWRFFELCNAAPNCNGYPAPAGSPGDEFWDKLLSSGRRVYGIASDDAHEYFAPYHPHAACGGRGYIMVRADKLDRREIVDAILGGDFYASTGVEIDEYEWDAKEIHIRIRQHLDEGIWFQFFGLNGEELSRTNGIETKYHFQGQEGYVRCRIASTAGTYAWTQPVFLGSDTRQSLQG
jgi:hypothetical protein